ncbi:hypothetical protein BU23DRAFT_124365 [Bimuria novae-zelandiae CBS 107.79]|uniref:Uncharacterized protein n=1 Tax=Bimuria novae-zelandiae CBS 107.79 TaxID=1447943 RepID=A0A6A5VAS0_9PLEO|nr:hypothetical protein BU23DRAFT_124365 [Bimuria novae-zelandiae CBS 107.79]
MLVFTHARTYMKTLEHPSFCEIIQLSTSQLHRAATRAIPNGPGVVPRRTKAMLNKIVLLDLLPSRMQFQIISFHFPPLRHLRLLRQFSDVRSTHPSIPYAPKDRGYIRKERYEPEIPCAMQNKTQICRRPNAPLTSDKDSLYDDQTSLYG